MAKSDAFARIHRDVMKIAAAIPPGRVATFAEVGAFLDVVPRQVAFLLARVNDPAREEAPWHRVVADDGRLGRPKYDAWGRSQRERLEAEGIVFDSTHKILDLSKRRFTPTKRNTGVTPLPRVAATKPGKGAPGGT
jgi:methylated-DNA-protein-cysteine methyltransferase-like protein